jgi:hypothetical protein
MSVYSNPSDGAGEAADAYIAAILELLGARDPLDVLRTTPDVVADTIDAVERGKLLVPESAGKWSMGQVVEHLADSELVWGWRLRLVLSEDRPVLNGFDQDRWADRLGYDEADPQDSLATFTALRRSNLRLLERATPDELKRIGVHVERGEESVARLIRLYAGHDLAHRRQLVRVRDTVAGSGP